MKDFPRMLYKAPGPYEIHGGRFDTLIVNDEAEQESAQDGGWHLTTAEAKEAHEQGQTAQSSIAVGAKQQDGRNPDDNDPPTREELEQKAKELGIEFSPNIGDKKLAERIDAALKA